MTTTTPTPTRPPAPPMPPMDPRIRERRIEVKRALGRRRLRALIIVGSVIVASGLAFLTVNSPLLDVDRVAVVGARHLSPAQVRATSRVHRHDALLFLDTAAVARRVEQLPWVEHAAVHRDFPDTIRIVVQEYAAVSFVRDGRVAVLLAANGRAIARVSTPPAGTAEIRGVRRAPALGELLSPPEAANVVPQLPRQLAQRVEAVDVAGSGIALDLVGRGVIRFGTADALAAKSAAALAVLAHIENAPFSVLDVSTPARPTLRD